MVGRWRILSGGLQNRRRREAAQGGGAQMGVRPATVGVGKTQRPSGYRSSAPLRNIPALGDTRDLWIQRFAAQTVPTRGRGGALAVDGSLWAQAFALETGRSSAPLAPPEVQRGMRNGSKETHGRPPRPKALPSGVGSCWRGRSRRPGGISGSGFRRQIEGACPCPLRPQPARPGPRIQRTVR